MNLTPRQSRIVACVAEYRGKHACAPGVKEIVAITGQRSHGGVRRSIEQCVRRGALTWENNRIRTLRVVVQREGQGKGGHMLWGCLKCVVDQIGIVCRDVTTDEIHTLTVTPDGAPRPTCRMCGAKLDRIEWRQDWKHVREPALEPI